MGTAILIRYHLTWPVARPISCEPITRRCPPVQGISNALPPKRQIGSQEILLGEWDELNEARIMPIQDVA
jgi:hypothetical protein